MSSDLCKTSKYACGFCLISSTMNSWASKACGISMHTCRNRGMYSSIRIWFPGAPLPRCYTIQKCGAASPPLYGVLVGTLRMDLTDTPHSTYVKQAIQLDYNQCRAERFNHHSSQKFTRFHTRTTRNTFAVCMPGYPARQRYYLILKEKKRGIIPGTLHFQSVLFRACQSCPESCLAGHPTRNKDEPPDSQGTECT